MKKAIKYIYLLFKILMGIIILVMLAIFIFAWIFNKESRESYENGDYTGRYNNRRGLAKSTMNQLKSYHNKTGHYPKSLQELPVYKDKELVYYINQDHSFSYYSNAAKNNSTYSFSWRDGAMNWTGHTCSNSMKKPKGDTYQGSHILHSFYMLDENLDRLDDKFDRTVCITTDLH